MVLLQCAVGLAVTAAPSVVALMVVDSIGDNEGRLSTFCLSFDFGAGSVQGFLARSDHASRVA